MNAERLEKVLGSARLPTLPAVALRVIELTENGDVSLQQLAEAIQADQGLSSKILKTVNSSYYGLRRPCSTISQAMVALGIGAVKTLALGFSLVKTIEDGGAGFNYADYWRRGVYTAVAAKNIAARLEGLDAEEVFLAGLMQDVGMLALFQALGEEYIPLLDAADDDHRSLAANEVQILGITHAEVSAALVRKWKFPEALAEPIRYHERPAAAPEPHAAAARCVNLGNLAADILADIRPDQSLQDFHQKCAQWLSMSAADTEALLRDIAAQAKDLAGALRVNVGQIPPAEEILARASERLVAISIQKEHEAERLAQQNAELLRAAVTDSLTGVANRRCFNEVLASSFEDAKAAGGAFTVVFLDADKFKAINDNHGHQAGDIVLVEIASRLNEHFGPSKGLVCRFGGEEFAVALVGMTRQDAARLAEDFRARQASRPIDISAAAAAEPAVTITVSIGVAGIDAACADAFPTAEHLIRAADQAVYAAKGAGRNCVRVFHPRPRTLPTNAAA